MPMLLSRVLTGSPYRLPRVARDFQQCDRGSFRVFPCAPGRIGSGGKRPRGPPKTPTINHFSTSIRNHSTANARFRLITMLIAILHFVLSAMPTRLWSESENPRFQRNHNFKANLKQLLAASRCQRRRRSDRRGAASRGRNQPGTAPVAGR